MSCITIVKEIKAIHPKDIALIRLGGFYRVYGRDAYIISNIFRYKVQYDEGIASCGFPGTKLLVPRNGTNVEECKCIENIENL